MKRKAKAAALPQNVLDNLASSGLDEADAREMQVTPVTPGDCEAWRLPAAAHGYKIPYFDIEGEPTAFFRVRYLEDTRKGFAKQTAQKPLRYGQVPDTVNEIYFPPLSINWHDVALDIEVPILITEGEKKAAAACKWGLACIGLGGVWCFQSTRSALPLLPGFNWIKWKGRTVYICYDSDAETNSDIVKAELRLAQRLVELGAAVMICRIKHTDTSSKLGLDDYLVLHGPEEFQQEVLDTAFEFAESKGLHELNQEVLYVRDPGLIWDRERRQRLTPSAFKEHAFSNRHIWERRATPKGETLVKLPAAKAWMEWEYRSECKGLVYAPAAPEITEDGYLNTWTGWGVPEPRKGGCEPWHDLMNHLFGEDKAARLWFEQWCAYPVQHPGVKMATAALVWGVEQGSGKTLVGHTLMRLYGTKNSAEIHDTDLEDDRNEWAADKQFVLVDDIVAKGDRKLMLRIMTLITQKRVRLNPKYIPSYFLPDTINYMFTSNEPDALYMESGDRRFFVHEVRAGKYTAYKRYCDWRDSDTGIAALWDYFLHLDLTGFDPQAPAPITEGKREMQEMGKSDLGAFVRDFKENGPSIMAKHGLKGDFVTSAELHVIYTSLRPGTATTQQAIARELKRAGFKHPSTGSRMKTTDGRMIPAYVVANHVKWAAAAWSEACRHFNEARPHLNKKEKF